jgi:hypothetical protein
MVSFDQGSVIPSNLKVRRPGKGRTAKTRMDRASVRPPNLVRPQPPACVGVGARTHVYARVSVFIFRLDKVRRLDRASHIKASARPTFPPNLDFDRRSDGD